MIFYDSAEITMIIFSDGERRYMCTTLKRFWDFYSTKSSRHLYELIAENMPCRLYFDLEYSKSSNKDVDHQVFFIVVNEVSHFLTLVSFLVPLYRNLYLKLKSK